MGFATRLTDSPRRFFRVRQPQTGLGLKLRRLFNLAMHPVLEIQSQLRESAGRADRVCSLEPGKLADVVAAGIELLTCPGKASPGGECFRPKLDGKLFSSRRQPGRPSTGASDGLVSRRRSRRR